MSQYDWRDILERNAPPTLPRPRPGYLTNWFGVQTDITLYSNRPDYQSLSEHIFSRLPIPHDMHHVDADEYGGLLLAIENREKKDTLVIIEIGAAWGPWISAGGIMARQLSITNLDLVGVEAEPQKFKFMREHMKHNGLNEDANTKINLICGAAWTSDSKIYFAAHESVTDYAGTAQSDETAQVNQAVKLSEVQGYTLATIIGERQSVDYIAMDIQGVEFEVLQDSLDLLNARVRFIMVGTHSAAIHGKLIELFFNNGWQVVWDKYPAYNYDISKPDLNSMTTIDGELILVNSALVTASPA